MIGRYRVDRKIGSGGMADAYRCVLDGPSGFQKFVLVKILKEEHRDSSHYFGMFLDEARLCAGFQHPNIPAVFELEEHDGLPFFVMEFVAGPNLVMLHRKLRDGRPRHFGHIAYIFERVSRALHHAHTITDADGVPMRLVHRDVSLANILVGRDGHPKLIDFGIAKWDNAESVTEIDVLKGKLRYMAPEQLRGDRPDARVDIYQMGVALYWLTTGRPPYPSTSALQHLQAQAASAPPLPRTLLHGYPPELERVVMKCIERDPNARYQTAAELADALKAFQAVSPEYASGDEQVAVWITELFPGNELEVYTARTGSGTHERSHTRPLPGHATSDLTSGSWTMPQQHAPPPPPPPAAPAAAQDRISAVGWAGLVLVAVVAAVMTTQYMDRQRAAQIQQFRSAYAEKLANDPDGAAHELLDNAEALLEERELAAARAMLKRAERIEDASPEVAMRLSRLQVEVDRIRLVTSARRAMVAGDFQRAIEQAQEVLELLPEDEDALSILASVRESQDANEEQKAAAARAVEAMQAAAESAERRAREAEARARRAEAAAREAQEASDGGDVAAQ